MIFSENEITRRWKAVVGRLGEAECVIAPSFYNSYYLSGVPVIQWGRLAITILFRDYPPILVLAELDRGAAERNSPIKDVRSYVDEDGPNVKSACQIIADALKERTIKKIGIEAEGMSHLMYLLLRAHLPEATFIDATAAVDDVRLISSPEEIEIIRKGAKIACVGMETAMQELRPGVKENHLASKVRAAMDRAVPSGIVGASTCYMQQGVTSIQAHALASGTVIKAGNFTVVTIEYDALHYQSTVERCILVGTAPKEIEHAVKVMVDAFNAATAKIRPGVTFSEVYYTGKKVFVDAGYTDFIVGAGLIRNVIHHTGGRIDAGNVRSYNNREIEPGMLITIEPWARVKGIGAAHHCDTVLVTEGGHEVLTPIDPGLIRIPA